MFADRKTTSRFIYALFKMNVKKSKINESMYNN